MNLDSFNTKMAGPMGLALTATATGFEWTPLTRAARAALERVPTELPVNKWDLNTQTLRHEFTCLCLDLQAAGVSISDLQEACEAEAAGELDLMDDDHGGYGMNQ